MGIATQNQTRIAASAVRHTIETRRLSWTVHTCRLYNWDRQCGPRAASSSSERAHNEHRFRNRGRFRPATALRPSPTCSKSQTHWVAASSARLGHAHPIHDSQKTRKSFYVFFCAAFLYMPLYVFCNVWYKWRQGQELPLAGTYFTFI